MACASETLQVVGIDRSVLNRGAAVSHAHGSTCAQRHACRACLLALLAAKPSNAYLLSKLVALPPYKPLSARPPQATTQARVVASSQTSVAAATAAAVVLPAKH